MSETGDIPAAERYPWQPAELVAVRGKHRWHTADSVGRLAVSADGKWMEGLLSTSRQPPRTRVECSFE